MIVSILANLIETNVTSDNDLLVEPATTVVVTFSKHCIHAQGGACSDINVLAATMPVIAGPGCIVVNVSSS